MIFFSGNVTAIMADHNFRQQVEFRSNSGINAGHSCRGGQFHPLSPVGHFKVKQPLLDSVK